MRATMPERVSPLPNPPHKGEGVRAEYGAASAPTLLFLSPSGRGWIGRSPRRVRVCSRNLAPRSRSNDPAVVPQNLSILSPAPTMPS